MRKTVISLVFYFGFCFLTMTGICNAEDSQQPNIVLILVDDLGYADVGFNGSKDIRTPFLDELAKGGTVFSSAYVAHPFCGPSRAALMTGRYPHKIGSQFNIPERGTGVGVEKGIPLDQTFFSEVLKDAGYFTGLVGKWHLGKMPAYHPHKRGFDDFYGFLGGGHCYHPKEYEKEYKVRRDAGHENIWSYYLPLEHNGKEVSESEYLTDALSKQGVRFINEATRKDKPFFLFLSYNAPHTPLEAKPEDEELYKSITDEKRRTYAAMVHAVDRGVGQVVEALKESEEYENTLIVFLSDNGGRTDQGGNNLPLRGSKGDAFEGGYRTPMLFHWAGKVPKQTYKYTVTALDFFPTFARLAGANVPDSVQLDGKDVWGQVLAGQDARNSEPFFVMRHRDGQNEVGVRVDQWKLYHSKWTGWQLFNVNEDVGESLDLSAKYPERVTAMIESAKAWSNTHIAPKWFDSENTRDSWLNSGMPNFDETFKKLQSSQ